MADNFYDFINSEGFAAPTIDTEKEDRGLIEEAGVGLKRGTHQTLGMLGGAAGLAGGLIEKVAPATEIGEDIQKWGFEKYLKYMDIAQKQYAPSVGGFSQIKSADDAAKWFAGTVGELAPTAAEIFISAALGGGVAGIAARKGGKEVLEKMLKKRINQKINSEVGERVIAKFGREEAEKRIARDIIKQAGATAGAFGGSTAMEAGGMYGEAAEDVGLDKASPFTALALGMISGATEVISPSGQVMTKLGIGTLVKDFKEQFINLGGKAALTKVGIKFAGDVLTEATQEGFQEFLNIVNSELNNPDIDSASKESLIRILDAAAAGAAGGVVFGGAKTVGRANAMQQKRAADKIRAEMEAEEDVPETPTETDIFGTPKGVPVEAPTRTPIVVPTTVQEETTTPVEVPTKPAAQPTAQGFPFAEVPEGAFEGGGMETGQEITFQKNGKPVTGTITKIYKNGTLNEKVGNKVEKLANVPQPPLTVELDGETYNVDDLQYDPDTKRWLNKSGKVVYPVVPTYQEEVQAEEAPVEFEEEVIEAPTKPKKVKKVSEVEPEAAPAPIEMEITQEDAEELATITEEPPKPKKGKKVKAPAVKEEKKAGVKKEVKEEVKVEQPKKKGKKSAVAEEFDEKFGAEEEVVEEPVAEEPKKKVKKKAAEPDEVEIEAGEGYRITEREVDGKIRRVAYVGDNIAGIQERPIYKTAKVNQKHKENDTITLIENAEEFMAQQEAEGKAATKAEEEEVRSWADRNIVKDLEKEHGQTAVSQLATEWLNTKEIQEDIKAYKEAKKSGDAEDIAITSYNLGLMKKAVYEEAGKQLTAIEADRKKSVAQKRKKEEAVAAKEAAREEEKQAGKAKPIVHGKTLQARVDAGSILMDADGRAFATKKDATARVTAVKRVVSELGFDPNKVSIIQTARLKESEDYRGGDIAGTYVIRYTGKVGEGIDSPLTHPYIQNVVSIATDVKEKKEAVVTHHGVKYRQPYKKIEKGLVSTSATLQQEVYFDNTEDNTRWMLVPQEQKDGAGRLKETGKVYVVKADPNNAYDTHSQNVADWPAGDYKLFPNVIAKDGTIHKNVLEWVTNHYYKNSPSSLIGKTFPFTKKKQFEKYVKVAGDKRLEVVPVAKDKGNKVIWGVMRKGDPLAKVYKTREEAINEGIPQIDPNNQGNLVYVDKITTGLHKGKYKVYVQELREGVSVLKFIEDKIQIMEKITPELAVRKTVNKADLEQYFKDVVPEAEDRAKMAAILESRIAKAAERNKLGEETYVQELVWGIISQHIKPTKKGTLNKTQITKFKKKVYTEILEKYNTTFRNKKLGKKQIDKLSKRVRAFTAEVLGLKDTGFMDEIENQFKNLERVGIRRNIYRTQETIGKNIDFEKEKQLKLIRNDKLVVSSELTGVQFPKMKSGTADIVLIQDIERLQKGIYATKDATEALNVLDDMYGMQENFYQEALYNHGQLLINKIYNIDQHTPYLGITIKTGTTIGKIVDVENNDFIILSSKGLRFRLSHRQFFKAGNQPIYYKSGKKWKKVSEGFQNPDYYLSSDDPVVIDMDGRTFAELQKDLLDRAYVKQQFQKRIPTFIEQITKSWANKPEIVIVKEESDYSDMDFIEQHGIFDPLAQRATGFISKNKTVYINAWKMRNKTHLTHVLLHEVIGHWGLRSVFGNGLNDVFIDMIRDIGVDSMARYLNDTGYAIKKNPKTGKWSLNAYQMAEEYAAQVAASGLKPSWMRKMVTSMKRLFKRLGWNVRLTEEDVVSLVANSHNYIVHGKGTRKRFDVLPMAHKEQLSRFAEMKKGQISTAARPAAKVDEDVYMLEAAKNIITAAPKAYKEHSGVVGNIINRMTPLGNLVHKGKYLKIRYETLGKLGNVEQRTKEIFNLFKKQTEDTPRIYQYLTTKNANPDSIKNKLMRDAAVKVKSELYDNGKMLVERGLLSKEALDKWGGAYLPRVYLKHLLNSKTRNSFGSGKTLSGIYALPRTADETYRKVLGEIQDPAYLSSRGYSMESRDIILFDWLQKLSENTDWVLPQSFVEYKNKKVTPTYLKAAAEHLRKTADAAKLPMTHEMRKAAQEMEAIANKSPDIPEELTKNFRKLPNNSKYGRLAGMWVEKHIYADIVETSTVTTGEESIAEQVLGHNKFLTRLTKKWKWAKVAANIPAHGRNFVTNSIMLYLSGMSAPAIAIYYKRALSDIAKKGKYYQIAQKYGVSEATFTNTELWRIDRALNHTISKHKAETNPNILTSTMNTLGGIMDTIVDKTGAAYQWSEALGKTAKLMYEMEENNASEEHAALEAHKWLFDYSLVTPSMKYLRNAPIGVPFLTFNMKVMPRLLEVARTDIYRYMPFVLMPLLMADMVKAAFDFDDDDYKKLLKNVPKWMQEQSNIYLMPMRDSKDRLQAVNVDYFLPWAPWREAAKDMKNGAIKGDPGKFADALKSFGLFGGPVPQAISAFQTGIDPFTGREIYSDTDSSEDKYWKTTAWLWTLSAPTWLTDNGFTGKMIDALSTAERNLDNDKPTMAHAMLRMVGINTYPIDLGRTRIKNIKAMKNEVTKAKAKMTKELNLLVPGTKKWIETRDKYRAILLEKQEELRKYHRESALTPKLQKEIAEQAKRRNS